MLPPCLGLPVCYIVLNLYFYCYWLLMAFGALICVIDYGLGFDRC